VSGALYHIPATAQKNKSLLCLLKKKKTIPGRAAKNHDKPVARGVQFFSLFLTF